MQNETVEKDENKHERFWQKWFQRDNLIILILSGVLLFIIALPTEKTTNAETENKGNQSSVRLQGSLGVVTQETNPYLTEENAETGSGIADYDYAAYLEQKLEVTLKDIDGVGEVEVMLTLQSSEELVVEKDAPVSRSNTNETDSEGGSRVISQIDTQETTIYRTEGSNSEPYVVKTILPKVEGVLVVAEGAGNGSVNKSITEIVQALFGVEAHKVKVVARKTES